MDQKKQVIVAIVIFLGLNGFIFKKIYDLESNQPGDVDTSGLESKMNDMESEINSVADKISSLETDVAGVYSKVSDIESYGVQCR